MRGARPTAAWVAHLAPVGAGTPPEFVVEQLRGAILAGQARPGAPIALDEVAARLATSRIPVREALRTLVAEGLVDHQPGRSYAVAALTRAELRELYVVRAALEGAALAAAVARATAADDDAVRQACAELGQVIDQGDQRGHHVWSRRFHLLLTAPSQMHRLLRLVEQAWNCTEPVRPMSHAAPEVTLALHTDHEQMLDAFCARDASRLVAISGAHHERLQDVVAAVPDLLS